MVKKIKKKKDVAKQRAIMRIIVFSIIAIALMIAAFFIGRKVVINWKYKQYTDKMYTYGLADLYNNKKATATETVTNEEMLKIVVAAISGKTDLDSLYYNPNVSKQDKLFSYVTDMGYVKDISKDNLQDNANKIDSVLTAIRAVDFTVDTNILETSLKMNKTQLSKFDTEEKSLIAKAVSIGLIPNKTSALSNKEIIKGELNKLVVTIIEKYSTIYYKANNQEQGGNIVTDKEKLPENYEEYPYIVDNIEKDVYEYDFEIITERTAQTPKQAYKYMGNLYGQIDELLSEYLDGILNVDYTTITTSSFLDLIQSKTVYRLEEDDVKSYVDYVKENKIKLAGKAEVLLPIIYNNGEQYIVRTKITFKVLNSDTEYNLLFGDENQKIKYNGNEITMYVDVPMGMTMNSWSLRVYVQSLAKNLVGNNTSVVVE